MGFRIVVLWTDILLFAVLLSVIGLVLWGHRREPMRRAWNYIKQSRLTVASIVILMIYGVIALLDSVHYQRQLTNTIYSTEVHYSPETHSLFDVLVAPLGQHKEKTYSAPFAKHLLTKESRINSQGQLERYYPPTQYWHFLGTDKVGNDVLYEALKSIRTGVIIGTITTLVMLPFAILLGIVAGYFGGWIDDVIQYIYTTLSSIPGVLLIAATILALQVFIANNSELFPNLALRADARLLALCIILGITSWTSLCRMLRGETLKIREIDYIQAARALGAGHWRIIWRHILPNVMHIVLIAIVLDFSALVLAEAVLSYVGVGVDPTSFSWGTMINSARLELAREPIVWWPLVAAFIFMFTLVLAANIFADRVREALDPRLH
ncbi:MAG: hypothetical protein Tsb005_09790 [Gammaproteobacteria bacterium]